MTASDVDASIGDCRSNEIEIENSKYGFLRRQMYEVIDFVTNFDFRFHMSRKVEILPIDQIISCSSA